MAVGESPEKHRRHVGRVEGDADAAGVLVGLFLAALRGDRLLDAHIEFGEAGGQAEPVEAADVGDAGAPVEAVLNAEVELEADAVQRHALAQQPRQQPMAGVGLGAGQLHAVVIVEELRVGRRLMRPAEGPFEILRADALVPGTVLTPAAAVGKRLVDDIPGKELVTEVPGHGEDVFLKDVQHLRPRPRALLQPWRQLVVPDQGVPAQLHAVPPREVHQPARLTEIELPEPGLQIHELHAVLGDDAVELPRQHAPVVRLRLDRAR
ncbi:MAG: hypothetical protein BWZ02_02625 [Lentisphaerae bacterium ADurb.BinA184]|nr:MAG: hypothetical protein BWZ02_02625 [Lentisphaerae bacterium ADurb.BinA184]